MFKRCLNVAIFIFIFSLYFVTFLMIYDTFRERKLNSMSNDALNILEKETKKVDEEVKEEEISATGISYSNYPPPSLLVDPALFRVYAATLSHRNL